MAYSDKEYFLKKIKLSELDNLVADDAGVADYTKLTDAVSSADSLIDGYLRGNIVTLPLDPVPPVIAQMSYDIAIFHLHDNIQYADIPERVKDKYDAAVNYLKDVAAGRVSLDTSVPEANLDDGIDYGNAVTKFDNNTF